VFTIIIIIIIMIIIIMIMIIIIIITVHLYSAHIHYLPKVLNKTIPKNYNFSQRNLTLKTSKISKRTRI